MLSTGVREQRKTEGQSNGPTLRQRDSERNSSGPSPELIGPGPENQALLHNGSGIAEAGLRGTHDGLSLSGTASAEGELIRAHARLTLYPTMGRLPVLRTDPTMTAAGYHSPESSVGSQSWSRDMSHGEAPLQVGSVAIVCEEQRKVKGVCLTSPLWK